MSSFLRRTLLSTPCLATMLCSLVLSVPRVGYLAPKDDAHEAEAGSAVAGVSGWSNDQGEADDRDESSEAAAIQSHEVYSDAVPGGQPRAEFWLGNALYNRGLYPASLSI